MPETYKNAGWDYPPSDTNDIKQFERYKAICPKCGWKATTTRRLCPKCGDAFLKRRA